MKATKFQRITALLLAVLCLFGGAAVTASANTVDSDESMLANIKELLNAISYNEYVQLEEYVKAEPAKKPVSVLDCFIVLVEIVQIGSIQLTKLHIHKTSSLRGTVFYNSKILRRKKYDVQKSDQLRSLFDPLSVDRDSL